MSTSQNVYAVLYCERAGPTPPESRWQLRNQDGVVLASTIGTYAQASRWARTRSSGKWPLYGTERKPRAALVVFGQGHEIGQSA